MFEIDEPKIIRTFRENKKKRTFRENIDTDQFELMDYLPELKKLIARSTQAEVADALGVTDRAVQFWVTEENRKVPQKKMQRKIHELFVKVVEQGFELSEASVTVPFLEQRREQKNADDVYLVPFIDIPAQAGYSKAYQQRDYIATLRKFPILPDVDPTGAVWRYFQIEGDSMEPEIMGGDVILCSQVHKEDWQSVSNYYTHVVVTDENLWIKDVYRDSQQSWFLLSQNEAYKPFEVKVRDIRQVWVMRRHIKNRVKKHRRYDISEIKKQINSGKEASREQPQSEQTTAANHNPFVDITADKKRGQK